MHFKFTLCVSRSNKDNFSDYIILFVGKVNVKDLTKKKRSALNKNDRRHQVNVDIKFSVQDTVSGITFIRYSTLKVKRLEIF